MGLLRSARDRFLPPSNRVYVSRSDTALSDLAALRQEVGQLKGAVVQLKGMVEQLAKGVGDVKGTQGAITSSIKQLSAAQEGRQKELLSILDCLMLTMSRRSLGRKTILLAGWYCAGNLGDELMLRTLVSYAPVSIRDDIYVLAWNDNPAFDPESLNDLGVHTIRYPCTTREIDMLAACFDVLVWGGGAILDDVQYDSRQDNYNTGNIFIRLSEIMLASNKKVYALGLGTNDAFSSEAYLKRLQRIIDGAELFTLRDQPSYDVLKESGINMERIGRCEDIAFANKLLMCPELRKAHDGKALGIVSFHIPAMHETNVAMLNDVLDLFSDEPSMRIVLIPFNVTADAWYLPKLRGACSDPGRVEIAPYADNLSDSSIFDCDFLVVSRYHAALIASVAGIPYICVVPEMHRHYRNKMRYLSQLVDYEDHFLSASDWSDNQYGKALLAQLFEDERQPHTPENMGSIMHDMIMSTWDEIEAFCLE